MRILHVFRKPVGGLFRHVADLVRGQSALGHEVGLICDSQTGGAAAEAELQKLAPHCALGTARIAISTLPGFGDLAASRLVAQRAKTIGVEIIHGHGAKGGVYARLAARKLKVPGVYTPHGGSLHYDWLKPPGAAFLAAERVLRFKGTGLIFVCAFERQLYDKKIGLGPCPSAVVYNGLWPEEFAPRTIAPDATDLLFVGEMRKLKGVDVLLQALATLPVVKRLTLTLVGEGADQAGFEALAQTLGLAEHVRFVGRKTMAEAKSLGRVLVLPSRHESFPYVILEGIAAQIPVLASNVGGIGEILPLECLVPADDSLALAQKLELLVPRAMPNLDVARALQTQAREKFSVARMTAGVLAFYNRLR